MKKYYPEILVGIRLIFIAMILLTAPVFNHLNAWLFLEILGIILAAWAFYEIKSGNINIRPVVKKDAVLITSGPYRWVRHPMYLATLLVMIALIGEYFSYIRLTFLFALLIVIVVKMSFEEKELMKHFSTYTDYIKKSKRLIPFIY